MQQFITFLFIIILNIISTYQQCACGQNQAYNFKQNKCQTYPKKGENGYTEGCKIYFIVHNSDNWQCSKCDLSYYKENVKCIKTDLVGCDDVEKQSPTQFSNDQINQRFLANSDTYSCRFCYPSQYYQKNGKCFENPKKGKEGYSNNCHSYIYSNQKLQCGNCESGYYRDINQNCIKNPSKPDKCITFSVRTNNTPWCQICQDGYIAVEGNKCESQDSVILNCKYYFMEISSPSIKNTCNQCNDDFHPNLNKTQCEQDPQQGEDNYVKNCNRYGYSSSNELECIQCDKDHIYDSSKKECNKVNKLVDNCQTYQYTGINNDLEQCSYCKANYQTKYNSNSKNNECNKCPNVPHKKGNSEILKLSLILLFTAIIITI